MLVERPYPDPISGDIRNIAWRDMECFICSCESTCVRVGVWVLKKCFLSTSWNAYRYARWKRNGEWLKVRLRETN